MLLSPLSKVKTKSVFKPFLLHLVDVTMEEGKPVKKQSGQMNMRGVFLHILGDALGSVVVIISALTIYFAEVSQSFTT